MAWKWLERFTETVRKAAHGDRPQLPYVEPPLAPEDKWMIDRMKQLDGLLDRIPGVRRARDWLHKGDPVYEAAKEAKKSPIHRELSTDELKEELGMGQDETPADWIKRVSGNHPDGKKPEGRSLGGPKPDKK